MASIYDVEAGKLIKRVAEDLKKIDKIKAPEWAPFVKTGVHKERPPIEEDWWYVRAAAVLRSINKLGPIGVSKLRTKYGGNQRRGYKPATFKKGSGNIIRKILQQLEAAGLIKAVSEGVHKGKVLTGAGNSILDKAATELLGPKAKVEKKATKKAEAEEAPAESDAEEKPAAKKKAVKKKTVKKKAAKKSEEPEAVEAKAEETTEEAPAEE